MNEQNRIVIKTGAKIKIVSLGRKIDLRRGGKDFDQQSDQHGVKVMLINGQVGRVKEAYN